MSATNLKDLMLAGVLALLLLAPAAFADEARASSPSIWELMQKTTTGTGPRDMARVSSPSIWELMQKTAAPSGPRDVAMVSSLSIWELMQKTAAPSGPRDVARASSVPSGGVGK